jgi:putative spermidine/putrescine transport system ATP-binding protein
VTEVSVGTPSASQAHPGDPASAAGDVELRAVTKRFADVVAVDDVSVVIRAGEFFALLGPSGSGKTTCLRMIAGLEQPTAGSVLLGGKDVTRVPPFDRAVNTVFQDYALFPHMSVEQNVAYGLMVRHVAKAERRQRVDEALATVRLAGLGGRRPAQLSGGQRQRVALARALVNRPTVLLLDEPLGALDRKLREQMQIELKTLQREVGITFVFVTHDQDEALTMSDRIAVFNAGRIEQVGPPADVYDRPVTPFVADFIGMSNVIDGEHARTLLGEAGTFSLRPERLHVGPVDESPAAGFRSADGVVADVVYAGAMWRYVVTLDAGLTFVITQATTRDDEVVAVRRGSRARVTWKHEDAFRVD